MKINMKRVRSVVEIENMKVVYKEMGKDGRKEWLGVDKRKVRKDR